MCSLHLTHPSGAVGSRHCSARGSVLGFGALLKGLTSVVDTSCQSRDLNPQPWVTSGFKSNALTIRPRLPHVLHIDIFLVLHIDIFFKDGVSKFLAQVHMRPRAHPVCLKVQRFVVILSAHK